MGEHHVHTEPGHEANDPLGQAGGGAAGGAGPGHGHLFSPELLHPSEVVNEVEGAGQRQGGMVHAAMEVHQGGALLQHSVLKALLHRTGRRLQIGVTLVGICAVLDADDIGHEGGPVEGLPEGLPTAGPVQRQALDLQAQQIAG